MWYVYLIIFVENQTFKRILCNKSKNHLLPCSLKLIVVCFSSVQLLSRVWLCDPKDCSTPGLPVHHQLLEFTQTHVHWVSEASNHLILCRPLLLLLSIFPSIKVFSNESVLHIRWPKYWSFSFSTSPSNEFSALIYFRTDWFELFAYPRDSQEFSLTP